MKSLNHAGRRIAGVVLAAAVLALSGVAQADPPSRVARIGYLDGQVSFAPSGDNAWVEARLNRPMTIGDSLWADNNARSEIQFGVATVRLAEYTSVQVLNLDDRAIQLRLSQGRVDVHARSLRSGEFVEIDTPNLAFTIRQAGDYRIDVDPSADATTVQIRRGSGDVYGEGAAYTLRGNDAARFYGRDLGNREFYSLAPIDGFDRWSMERDRRGERSVTSRYVSAELIGASDLDQYGTWNRAEGYGNVWFPREVPREWAPYRYGHWSWIDPWGWTWVDDAPWGFAPFHYGRWANFDNRWGWVPGPVNVRPVYAPALVAFVGGSNFRLSISSGPVGGDIGWFPLGPGEVYRPAYAASPDYVRNVNISNTIVNTTVINNTYNNQQTNITQTNYRNALVPNAVTAVAPAVFAQSQPVQRGMVAVSQDVVQRAQVMPLAAVAPTAIGMAGGAPATTRRPAEEVVRREIVVRTAPAAPAAPVAQRVDLLQRDPGRPLERSAVVTNAPAAAAANVRVLGNQAPQALPAAPQRGMAGPPPVATRPAGDAARAAPQGAVAAPQPVPGAPAPAAPQPLQRERGGMTGAAPGAAPVAAPQPPAAAAPPPGAPPQGQPQRDRGMGGANVPPPAPQPPAAAAPPPGAPPQGQPQRDRGMGGANVPPPAPQPPAAFAPPPGAPPQGQPQRDRGMGGANAPQTAPQPPAAAPPQPQRERGMGGGQGGGQPPPGAAPAPQAAPRPTPPAAPPAAGVPAAPGATPTTVAPPPPPPGKQEIQRSRGKGNNNDDDDKEKKDKK